MGAIKDPGEIKRILLDRENRVKGGVDVFLVGEPGCGKTTGLARICMKNQNEYDDVILWRGSGDCQWSFFLNFDKKLILWLKDNLRCELRDRANERVVDPNEFVHEVRKWRDPEDLVRRINNDAINIVQTTPYSPNPDKLKQHLDFCKDWTKILEELNKRLWNRSVTLAFDELEDLVPEGKGKDFWDVELSLSGLVRKLRKNDISSFFSVHSLSEVHWRVRKKIRWMIYMKGAEPEKKSQVKKDLSNLRAGEAFLEGNKFEQFNFDPAGEERKLRIKFTIKDSEGKGG